MSRPHIEKTNSLTRNGYLEQLPPKRHDEFWYPDEEDMLLNYLFEWGFSPTARQDFAEKVGRTLKAVRQRMQKFLYFKDKKNQKISNYKASRFRWKRIGVEFGPFDKKVLRCHQIAGVPLEVTAEIMQRTVEELKVKINILPLPTRKAKTFGL